jgi:magnesium-transporting ATPase (P-type)
MITGDHVNVGIETCRLIGLGTDMHAGEEIRNAVNPEARNQMIWAADGFAAVLPSDKREVVLTLRNEYGLVTGMTVRIFVSLLTFHAPFFVPGKY